MSLSPPTTDRQISDQYLSWLADNPPDTLTELADHVAIAEKLGAETHLGPILFGPTMHPTFQFFLISTDKEADLDAIFDRKLRQANPALGTALYWTATLRWNTGWTIYMVKALPGISAIDPIEAPGLNNQH